MADYSAKLNSIDQLRTLPVLGGSWPDTNASLTLEESIALAGHNERAKDFAKAIRGFRATYDMLTRPVLAVLGELNAGKSSVVASFLSEDGCKRVPRGEESEKGTHRFVYWIPSGWMSNEETKAHFLELLSAAHGDVREYLSNDPEVAAKQYNEGRGDKIGVPLIAADPALDRLSAALLDCPDVQTKHAPKDVGRTSRRRNVRLDFVADAARICSAFLVVWDRAKIRDGILHSVLDSVRERMPDAPLFLLINKIRPEPKQPTKTRTDKDLLDLIDTYDVSTDGCYGAFDFDIGRRDSDPGWIDLTPPVLVSLFREKSEHFPQFFSLAETSEENVPEAVADGRFLVNLPEQLDAAELQQQKLHDNWSEIKTSIKKCLKHIRDWKNSREGHARELHKGLLDLCTRNFTDPTNREPLQIPTEEFTKGFKESFERTAPHWVKVPLWVAKPVDRLVQPASDALRDWYARFRSMTSRQGVANELQNKLGLADANLLNEISLAEEMCSQRWAPEEITQEGAESAWAEVIRNFYRFPFDPDPNKLDEMTKDLWAHITIWQRFRIAVLAIFRALASVVALCGFIVAIVDGGATVLASFSIAQSLAAGIPGLAGAGVGFVGTGAAFAGFISGAVNLNTLPYLSRFFALACDAFAIPRTVDGKAVTVAFGKPKKTFPLPDPGIPEQQTVCKLEDVRLWHFADALGKWSDIVRND